MCSKCTKNYHFYVEIVKFRLIWTHLKLFLGKTRGKKIFLFWGCKCPPTLPATPPLLTLSDQCKCLKRCYHVKVVWLSKRQNDTSYLIKISCFMRELPFISTSYLVRISDCVGELPFIGTSYLVRICSCIRELPCIYFTHLDNWSCRI